MLLNLLKKVWPQPATRQSTNDAQVHARAIAEFDRGEYAAALALLQQALHADPRNADILIVIAKCHQALGNIGEMQAAIGAALAINDNHLPTHQLQAKIALPGPVYVERLIEVHAHLLPRTYLEIGVAQGRTIALAKSATIAVGVDPEPRIEKALDPSCRIFAEPSDDFFARDDLAAIFGGKPLDLAFIDGMHKFEYALRDFIGAERLAAPHATILVHDTYPLNRVTAERERKTVFWSGDIWRMVMVLKKHRPDLAIHTVATAPTGLTVIRNLDPGSQVLANNLDAICAEFLALDYSAIEHDKPAALNTIANDWPRIRAILDEGRV